MDNYKEILAEYTYPGASEIIERISNASKCDERDAQDIINAIVLWKVKRQVDIGLELFNRIKHLELDDPKDVQMKQSEIKEIINLLLKTKGVRIAMASTILKMFYPDIFPILDQRAYRKLNNGKNMPTCKRYDEWIGLYMQYLEECHNYYNANCVGQIDFRDLDKVLYQMDKRDGNKVKY